MNTPVRHPVEERVLELVRPTRIQLALLGRLYRWIEATLRGCLEARGLEAEVRLVGSAAKGTLLRDKTEIDVFVLFRGVDDEWINREAEPLLTGCLGRRVPLILRYSQHPYVTVSISGLEADVVPALYVDRPRRKGLGVERTPFHTDYVLSRLPPEKRDDVRLLKSFLKGIGVYGAEAHVAGFSGYLSELLVIAYGGFREVLEAASSWRPPVYVDPEGLGDREALERKYPDSPVIVVDPVDPERNAAAAVSTRSLATFITAARLYLEKPTIEFFHVSPPRRGPQATGKLLKVEFTGDYLEKPPETVGSKAARAARLLASELLRHGFPAAYYSWETDEAHLVTIMVLLEDDTLPPYEHVRGPEAWDRAERTRRFLQARTSRGEPVWIGDDGRLHALRRRRYTDAKALATDWAESVGARILEARSFRVEKESCPGGEACAPGPAWLRV